MFYLIEISKSQLSPINALENPGNDLAKDEFAQVALLVLPGLEFEARWRSANKWSIYQPAIRAYPSYALILRAVITNQYYTALMRRITRNVGERVL